MNISECIFSRSILLLHVRDQSFPWREKKTFSILKTDETCDLARFAATIKTTVLKN